jgi:AcrR family transcriptional regulator
MSKRDPFLAPQVESRRGGPAKQPLSRGAIVSEGLRQLRTGGESLSLRKVAAALETGPASLYAYVEDLDELRALVLDHALKDVALGGTAGAWRERVNAVLESYVSVLSASPALARLAFGTIAVGPNALRIVEKLLALLTEAGADPDSSAWGVDLLVLYVTAIAAEHTGGGHPGVEGPVAQALDRATEQDYPHVFAARARLLSGTGVQRFGWALDVLVGGILNARPPNPQALTPRAPAPTRRRRS